MNNMSSCPPYSPLDSVCSPQSVVSIGSEQDQTMPQSGNPWSPLDDSAFYQPPELLGGYPGAPTPPPSLTTSSEDLKLAVATMKAEATGSATPLIKEEIRYKIQKKRRQSGLGELKVEMKPEGPEILTPMDEERRRRRRASNRRAATKCREKKKKQADELINNYDSVQQENADLRRQVQALEADRDRLNGILRQHEECCQLDVTLCLDSSSAPTSASPQPIVDQVLPSPQSPPQDTTNNNIIMETQQIDPQPPQPLVIVDVSQQQSLLHQLEAGDFSVSDFSIDLVSLLEN